MLVFFAYFIDPNGGDADLFGAGCHFVHAVGNFKGYLFQPFRLPLPRGYPAPPKKIFVSTTYLLLFRA
jgi:hypothetical protein